MKKRVTNRSPRFDRLGEKRSTYFQDDNLMKEETALIKIKGYANLLLMSEIAKTPYLEPDILYGYGDLEAVKCVFGE